MEQIRLLRGRLSVCVTHLEGGDREHPTRAVVNALIGYLDRIAPLADAERRHLFDLAGLSVDAFPAVPELRAEIGAEMRNGLRLHEPNPASYLDTRWNILSCNDAYAATFPGLVDDINVLRWFFGNELSKQVMVEWEREAALTVDWLRGLIGQSGDTGWSTEFLDELGAYPDFRRMWNGGGTTYGRTRPMRIRDLPTGEYYALDVQMFRVDSGNHPGRVQFFLGIRTPCAGPEDGIEPGSRGAVEL